eukprot:TRINITY_DN3836_c0_g3_i1.p1 TRINITY_DN3836_c0_g3~~TRINITY_DN3836_c0_g3_i1.p1  ORF type:complete len:934 (+),score=129.85 TRINITY_DN3836_c0_g3_i1:71-2803(+)
MAEPPLPPDPPTCPPSQVPSPCAGRTPLAAGNGQPTMNPASTVRMAAADLEDAIDEVHSVETAALISALQIADTPPVSAISRRTAPGIILVEGPGEDIQRVRVTDMDSADAVEHCLRNLFNLPAGNFVLRDADGCAVPLGPALARFSDAAEYPHYRIEQKDFHPDLQPQLQTRISSGMRFDADSPHLRRSLLPTTPAFMDHTEECRNRLFSSVARLDRAHTRFMPVPAVCAETVPDVSPLLPGLVSDAGRAPTPRLEVKQERQDELHLTTTKEPAPIAPVCTPPTVETDMDVCPQHMHSGKWMLVDSLDAEYTFWQKMAENGAEGGLPGASAKSRASKTTMSPATTRSKPRMLRLTHYDTSAQRIDALYVFWAERGKQLRLHELTEGLASDCGLAVPEAILLEALERVGSRFEDKEEDETNVIPRIVFASLWQRLMLGACSIENEIPNTVEDGIFVVEYSDRGEPAEKTESQRTFLFGGRKRNRRKTPKLDSANSTMNLTAAGAVTRWAWIEAADHQLLKLLGVKFFLHPLAVEDMVAASKGGFTKIDRYRHQYFVSLEIYSIDAQEESMHRLSSCETADSQFSRYRYHEPDVVGSRITRSTLTLVATGNPPTRAKISNTRDWLITVVNDGSGDFRKSVDPLDRFASNQDAAKLVLDKVRDDLWSQKRQREYQADFLLYSIVDKAAHEFTPIYSSYGHRLRWLQDSLEAGTLTAQTRYVEEVSKVRLELQELHQWIGSLRGIIQHMEYDCQHELAQRDQSILSFGFGSDSKNSGKSILVFLRHTKDYLEQADDKIRVLDDLARTFLADTERYKSDFMNQTLFVLTIATAVFMPAQFLAGVYGMNFEEIPELKWKNGYYLFWVLAITCVVFGLGVMFLCLRCRGCSWHRHISSCACGCCTRRCRRSSRKRA